MMRVFLIIATKIHCIDLIQLLVPMELNFGTLRGQLAQLEDEKIRESKKARTAEAQMLEQQRKCAALDVENEQLRAKLIEQQATAHTSLNDLRISYEKTAHAHEQDVDKNKALQACNSNV
eukprot:SAG11_NODE_752_length_7351_cov_4.119691_2_plen_120_part_00